jgi:TolA-binding protein
MRSCALGAAFALAAAGCATTPPPKAEADKEQRREVSRLRDRVLRLERRLGDIDAQLRLLTERPTISRGAPAYTPPAPAPVAPYGAGQPPAYGETYGDTSYGESATRSIDIPGPPGARAVDLEPTDSTPEFREVPIDDEPMDQAPATSAATDPEDVAPATQLPPATQPEPLYAWARDRQKEGRYLEAMAAFREILDRHAGHHLADNALYWTADCHLARGDARQAIDTWKRLPLRFPKSPKLPDSLYGMAQAHEKLGEPALAETLYAQLVDRYPKAERTPEARKAIKRLSGAPDAPR